MENNTVTMRLEDYNKLYMEVCSYRSMFKIVKGYRDELVLEIDSNKVRAEANRLIANHLPPGVDISKYELIDDVYIGCGTVANLKQEETTEE